MLELVSVSKKFSGLTVLDPLTVSLDEGQIVGLLGPNGAGKTTLLRIMATILPVTAGKLRFKGKETTTASVDYRQQLGYMPEDGCLYQKFNPLQNLTFYKNFYTYSINGSRLFNLIKEFKLETVTSTPVGRLSRGTQKKILFIKSLINNPVVLLLDEPMNNLDPEIRIVVKRKLTDLRNEGKLVILSSHALSELENLCDRVLILKSGRLVSNTLVRNISSINHANCLTALTQLYLECIGKSEN